MNFNNKEREMSEQKFKVVKCLEYIPEKLWGMVLEEEHPSRSNAECDNALGYCLSDTDTFPLPEQGDKVEFSMNGLVKWDWATFICYYDGKFILKSQIDDIIARYYIRPIEAKEESNDTNSLKHLTTDNKVMTTVGRNYRIELKIEHELVYDKHDDGTFTPVINMDVKDVSLIPIKTDKS